MTKQPIAFLMTICMAFGAMFTVIAQDDSPPMWESIMITPDNTNLKTLSDNMRKHNQTYHSEGPYHVTVYNINSGPNSGKIIWMMGPMKYSHNDTRPGEGGHDEDWGQNVMPYIKKLNTVEYWSQDNDVSNTSMLTTGPEQYPLQFVRYQEINKGHISSVRPYYEMISKTVKAMEGDNPWGVYYNEFRQGDLGRHVASVSFYKNWADFEKDNNFKEQFIKANGKNSWQRFLDLGSHTFSNSWDEVWSYNKHMSGD